MEASASPALHRYLPQVVLATSLVVVYPVFGVWEIRSSGLVTSTIGLVIAGIVISLTLGWLGRLYWESRPASEDLLFGELMIWGFLRRWRIERRLASTRRMLGLTSVAASGTAGELGPREKAEALEELAHSLESRDPYTHGHSRRVARHAEVIAERMGLPAEEVARVRTAATLHDVGKIDTPAEILRKPGKLSAEEFAVIQEHPGRGAEMVRDVDSELARIVAHHHERLDGTGYPAGLCGEEIPLGSRIIAVADTFDALTSARPYRAANPHKKALAILHEEAGTQLDPAAVRAFCSHYSGLRPLALWGALTNLPQRVLYGIFGELNATGGALSAAKAAATAAVAVGAGGVIATAPVLNSQPAEASGTVVATQERQAASGKLTGAPDSQSNPAAQDGGHVETPSNEPGADLPTDPVPEPGPEPQPVRPPEQDPAPPATDNGGNALDRPGEEADNDVDQNTGNTDLGHNGIVSNNLAERPGNASLNNAVAAARAE